MKIIAFCLNDYSNTWDLIPDILRLSRENPAQNTSNIKSLAQLQRIQTLLETVKKDLERANKEGIKIQRPKRPLQIDKEVMKLFSTGDMLLKTVADLKGGKEEIEDSETLFPIIQSLGEDITEMAEDVKLEKKSLDVKDHEYINDIATEMRVFPSRIVSFIQSRRKKAKIKKKLYVDMDGCLCNWEKAVKELGPEAAKGIPKDAEPEEKKIMWDLIDKAGPDFWSKMEWMPEGKKLWDLVKDKDPVLLTSPGLQRFAEPGKQIWVDNNLPGVPVFFEIDKFYYAEPDSILIDDMKDNIDAWVAHGGEGIWYQEDNDKVKEILDKLF